MKQVHKIHYLGTWLCGTQRTNKSKVSKNKPETTCKKCLKIIEEGGGRTPESFYKRNITVPCCVT